MCNTANKKAEKGSKYWMQEIVNNEFLRKELENKLKNESLEWISPLESESYDEYKLTEDKLKKKIPDLQDVDFSFWPKNGMLLHYLKMGGCYIFLKRNHMKKK